MNTPVQIANLIEAMDQVLDDMGKKDQSVCLHTKANARIAWEPFRTYDADDFIMSLADAQAIVEEFS